MSDLRQPDERKIVPHVVTDRTGDPGIRAGDEFAVTVDLHEKCKVRFAELQARVEAAEKTYEIQREYEEINTRLESELTENVNTLEAAQLLIDVMRVQIAEKDRSLVNAVKRVEELERVFCKKDRQIQELEAELEIQAAPLYDGLENLNDRDETLFIHHRKCRGYCDYGCGGIFIEKVQRVDKPHVVLFAPRDLESSLKTAQEELAEKDRQIQELQSRLSKTTTITQVLV